jgi:general secretion pathway protein D
LTYPRDRLQWIAATEGEFLQRDGARVSVSQQLDPGGGRVHLALLRRAGTGVLGEGSLLKLRFRALAPGPATLSVDEVRPVWLTPGEGGVQQAPAWTLHVE